MMRLNLFIAKSGVTSRRKADLLIKEGRVKVNSKIILSPGLKITQKDSVFLDKKELKIKQNLYFIFNKPKGVTSTTFDRFAKSKVIDFLPKDLFKKDKRIYPVGRLDKDSCGLLILTNDGNLCYEITHPKFSIEKEYFVKVRGQFNDKLCQKANKGINDKGDKLAVDQIKIIKKDNLMTVCKVITHEGKKRHIRRIFESLGFFVLELKRVRIGRLNLGDIKPGKYKILSQEQIYSILFNKK